MLIKIFIFTLKINTRIDPNLFSNSSPYPSTSQQQLPKSFRFLPSKIHNFFQPFFIKIKNSFSILSIFIIFLFRQLTTTTKVKARKPWWSMRTANKNSPHFWDEKKSHNRKIFFLLFPATEKKCFEGGKKIFALWKKCENFLRVEIFFSRPIERTSQFLDQFSVDGKIKKNFSWKNGGNFF